MKMNKKIIVASLSTVMGLSLVGAITGTVAWYQYSTRANVGFIGTSVADSGLLQVSKTGTDGWGRDIFGTTLTGSTNDNKLTPVTFGAMKNDGSLPVATPYSQPESGLGAYTSWKGATLGKEYLQFDVYLRAVKVDSTAAPTLVAKDVYLSDITIQDAAGSTLDVSSALRIHIAVNGGKNFLLSESAVTDLPLYGSLDLDGDTYADKVRAMPWETGYGNTCVYGTADEVQSTKGISDLKVTRKSDGSLDLGADAAAQAATKEAKCICTTSTTAAIKLTITIWLEGWAQIGENAVNAAMWDVTKTVGAEFNVGLVFDVGRDAFAA